MLSIRALPATLALFAFTLVQAPAQATETNSICNRILSVGQQVGEILKSVAQDNDQPYSALEKEFFAQLDKKQIRFESILSVKLELERETSPPSYVFAVETVNGKASQISIAVFDQMPSFGTLPLPTDSEAVLKAAEQANRGSAEGVVRIHKELLAHLNSAGIDPRKIHSIALLGIRFEGAREARFAIFQFSVTQTSGKVTQIQVPVNGQTDEANEPSENSQTLPANPARIFDASRAAAQAYGESYDAILSRLLAWLPENNVLPAYVHNVEYGGAVWAVPPRSQPPFHQFKLTLTDGQVKHIEIQIPVVTKPIPEPALDTMPVPGNPDAVEKALRALAGSDEALYKRLYESFAESARHEGVDLTQVHSVEFTGSLETNPPSHSFKVTLTSGLVTELGASEGW